MAETKKQFQPGDEVMIICPTAGCQGKSFKVTLGRQFDLHLTFTQSGSMDRLSWDPSAQAFGFQLDDDLGGSGWFECSGCRTMLGIVIIIQEPGKLPLIFGHYPTPC